MQSGDAIRNGLHSLQQEVECLEVSLESIVKNDDSRAGAPLIVHADLQI